MNQVEIIIVDTIAKFAEYGYQVKAEYTYSSDGEVISIRLVVCGRLN